MIENPEIDMLIARLCEVEEIADCMKHTAKKKYNKAEKCFDAILEENAESVPALLGKAVVMNQMNEWGKAIQHVTNALRIEPENTLGHMIKAEIFYTHEKFDLAVGCYTKLMHLLPSDEDVWFRLGEMLDMDGKPDEATDAFKQVLSLNPENERAKVKMGADVYRCPTCSSFIKEGEVCPNCDLDSRVTPEVGELDMAEIDESENVEGEAEALADRIVDEETEDSTPLEILDETEMVMRSLELLEEEVTDPAIEEKVPEPAKRAMEDEKEPFERGELAGEKAFTRGAAVTKTRYEPDSWDAPAGRDWMTIRDMKMAKRGSSVNLIGLFCIIVLAVYFMYLAANPIYDNLTGEIDYEVLVPNLIIFFVGFGALYGGISAAKNSIIFDHFLNSTFESEIFQRLEPAFEEIAETQVRLEEIEMKMDRLNLNIQRYKRHPPVAEFPSLSIESKISMFLKIVVVINMTVGIFLYTLRFPGEYVPYVFTIMFILWWLVITEEFRLWKNPTAWAMVVLPVFAVPVMSILLYVVISIGMLIGIIGIFLSLYAFGYFTWARFYVEGVLPFSGINGEESSESGE